MMGWEGYITLTNYNHTDRLSFSLCLSLLQSLQVLNTRNSLTTSACSCTKTFDNSLKFFWKIQQTLQRRVEVWEVMCSSVYFLRRDCTRWYNIDSYNHEYTVIKKNNMFLSYAQSIVLWCMLFGVCSLFCLLSGNGWMNHEKNII